MASFLPSAKSRKLPRPGGLASGRHSLARGWTGALCSLLPMPLPMPLLLPLLYDGLGSEEEKNLLET
ncbi:unnamed protein product [Lampetra fluviatilis]